MKLHVKISDALEKTHGRTVIESRSDADISNGMNTQFAFGPALAYRMTSQDGDGSTIQTRTPTSAHPTRHTVNCRIIVCFARVYRVGVWFRFVGSALLLAVIACIVLSFEAMPCLPWVCFFSRVTHGKCMSPGDVGLSRNRPRKAMTDRTEI